MTAPISATRPIIFGEILFDCFPDGHHVLGGAPFNVAWHLQGFGLPPLVISAVGDDALGARIKTAMRDWGMDLSGLQTNQQPTGSVQVSFNNGEPAYDIITDRAWDAIDANQARAAVAEQAVMLLYHGTLALRSHDSRVALETLRDGLCLPTLVDVNLRPPWWQHGIVRGSLSQARWGKLNDHELRAASDSEALPDTDLATMAKNLRARHGLDLLVVTEGARGALLVTSSEIVHEAPPTVSNIVDTVGAGDAFSAVLVIGLMENWPLQQTLQRALHFAADIVTQRGATNNDAALYQRHRQHWQVGST